MSEEKIRLFYSIYCVNASLVTGVAEGVSLMLSWYDLH